MLFHYSIGTNVVSTPTWTRTRTKTLGKSRAVHYTIGIKSRRLDSHQHDLVYKTSAFLNRATSAIRVTERNRTAVQQIHSLSPETSTGPGHSGRDQPSVGAPGWTRKAVSSTGFQPAPVVNRVRCSQAESCYDSSCQLSSHSSRIFFAQNRNVVTRRSGFEGRPMECETSVFVRKTNPSGSSFPRACATF